MQKRKASYELKQPASYDPTSPSPPYVSGQSCTAVLGAMTKAMQAQRVLAQASIRATVTKVSSSSQAGGCVYGVVYPCSQDTLVREVLAHSGMRVRGWM